MNFVRICAALLMCAPTLLQAQETAGQQEYMVACAVCHGESGRGDGPMAEVLSITTPNLTQLAKNNDGVFPFMETFMIVDGRTGLRGHGGPMPVWGERFQVTAEKTAGPFGAEVIVRGRLMSLTLYLASIQDM